MERWGSKLIDLYNTTEEKITGVCLINEASYEAGIWLILLTIN